MPIIPIKIKQLEIISACVIPPNILYFVFTLIFSIKNLSRPFKHRYIQNKIPGIFIFFLIDHKIEKIIVAKTVS